MDNYKNSLHNGNLNSKTYFRRLFPHTLPHGNHNFILCRLWHKDFPTVRAKGKKKLQQSSTVHKHILGVELFMTAVYITAIDLQPHSPHYHIWGLHTQSREHAPQNLTQYFLKYCFYRFTGIKYNSMKGVQSYFKFTVWRRKHIYKKHTFWSLSTFLFSSSLLEKEY